MPEPFYRGTQAELATGARNLVDIVTPVPAVYGLSPALLSSYTAATSSYENALSVATEPATRTVVTVAEKESARRILRAASVDIARIITATATVTNAQLLALRLNPRVQPQPRPVPTEAPAVDMISVIGRTARFRIHNNASESKRAKAPGAIGANIYTFVGEHPPVEASEYEYQGMTTRTYADVQFPASIPSGATVWVSCCWVGSRGQLGNASAPISFALQGGAVPAAA